MIFINCTFDHLISFLLSFDSNPCSTWSSPMPYHSQTTLLFFCPGLRLLLPAALCSTETKCTAYRAFSLELMCPHTFVQALSFLWMSFPNHTLQESLIPSSKRKSRPWKWSLLWFLLPLESKINNSLFSSPWATTKLFLWLYIQLINNQSNTESINLTGS